jgi:hypothetical protein
MRLDGQGRVLCCVVVGRGSRIGHRLLCLKHKQLARSIDRQERFTCGGCIYFTNGLHSSCSCFLRGRDLLLFGRDARNAGSGLRITAGGGAERVRVHRRGGWTEADLEIGEEK